MLDTQSETLLNLEIRILEYVINEDDVKCESSHDPEFNPVCSVEAVAICLGCTPKRFLACQNTVKAYESFMRNGGICVDCKKDARDCWRLIPI